MEGWIKSYRAVLENPIVCKDADHFAVWGYLLHNAAFVQEDTLYEGRRIKLNPGQLITGRKKIAAHFKISESKVQRILTLFESERQIERQPGRKSTLISICNWHLYQSGEQQNERQVNDNRTTSEQQLNTIIRTKELKKDKNTHTDSLLNFSSRAREFLDWVNESIPSVMQMPEPFSEQQAIWIVSKYSPDDIKRILRDMHNKGATERNKSAYDTFNSYVSRDTILKEKKAVKFYSYDEMFDEVASKRSRDSDFELKVIEGKNLWVKTTEVLRSQTN